MLAQQPLGQWSLAALCRAEQVRESPRTRSREPWCLEEKCGWTWESWGLRSFEGGLKSTCCGVLPREGRKAQDCSKAHVWMGVEARRGEKSVCLRSPQNVGKPLRATHSWSDGLMPIGLPEHQGIMPLNSDKVNFPGWGHCRGCHVEL